MRYLIIFLTLITLAGCNLPLANVSGDPAADDVTLADVEAKQEVENLGIAPLTKTTVDAADPKAVADAVQHLERQAFRLLNQTIADAEIIASLNVELSQANIATADAKKDLAAERAPVRRFEGVCAEHGESTPMSITLVGTRAIFKLIDQTTVVPYQINDNRVTFTTGDGLFQLNISGGDLRGTCPEAVYSLKEVEVGQ